MSVIESLTSLRDVHTPESYSDTQEGIRERTTQLSDMLVSRPLTLRPPLRLRATPEENAAPTVSQILMSPPPMPAGIPKLADIPPVSPLALPEGTSTPRSLLPSYSKQSSGQNTPRALSPAAPKQSGISLLVARGRSASRSSPNSPAQSPERSISRPSRAGQHQPATPDVSLESELSEPEGPRGRTLKPIRELEVALHESSPEDMESAPLLDYEREVNGLPTSYGASNGAPAAGFGPWKKSRFRLKPLVHSVAVRVRSVASPRSVKDGLIATVACLPAVLLGLLLNILDGVSYGFIIFPPGPTFPGFGALGVSMFFVT
jgi:SulP family sulfate permease